MKEHDKMQANTREIVEWHLRKIGIPLHTKGFQYLEEAIVLSVENPSLVRRVSTQLYPKVASIVGKSVWAVENRINDVVRKLFHDSQDLEKFKEYFGNSISTIHPTATSSELIAAITLKIAKEPPNLRAISEQLLLLGIPMNLNGYYHLKEAIAIAIENPDMLLGDVTGIYSKVGEKENLDPIGIAKEISVAILAACSRVSSEEMKKIFGNTLNYQKGKPTSSAVIVAVRERVISEAPQIKTAVKHLQKIGIPMHLKGFYCLKKAIELAMEKTEMLEWEKDDFCRAITESFEAKGVNVSVEYQIKRVINIAYEYNSKAIFKEYFGDQKPDIMEFIKGVTKKNAKIVSINP